MATENNQNENGLRHVVDQLLPALAFHIGMVLSNTYRGGKPGPGGDWNRMDKGRERFFRDVVTRNVNGENKRAWRYSPWHSSAKGRTDQQGTVQGVTHGGDVSVEFYDIRIRRVRKVEFGELEIGELKNRKAKVVKFYNNSSSDIPIRREVEDETETEETNVDEKEISAEFKEATRVSASYLSVNAEVSVELTQAIKDNSSRTLRSLMKHREVEGREYKIKPYSDWSLNYETGSADVSQDTTIFGQLDAGVCISNGQETWCFDRLEAMRDAFAGISTAENSLAKWYNDFDHALGRSKIERDFAVPDAEIVVHQTTTASAVENSKVNERWLTEDEKNQMPEGTKPQSGSLDDDDWSLDI